MQRIFSPAAIAGTRLMPVATSNPNKRRAHEHGDGNVRPAKEGVKQQACGHRSRDDHRVNCELHQAVGARKSFLRKNLRQNSFLGGIEEAGMNSQQEEHRQHCHDVPHEHRNGGDHQQRGLNHLHEDDHAALGKVVRHLARIRGEHDVRQHVERGAEGNVKIPRGKRRDAGSNEQHQELLEGVVVKHGQCLRRQQENKSPVFENA